MRNLLAEVVEETENTIEAIKGVRLGRLRALKKKRQLIIDYPDNPFGPLLARSTCKITQEDEGREILLAFENSNPRNPIIIGVIHDSPIEQVPEKILEIDRKEVSEAVLDGERITFNATKEIVLKCGKGSITIRKDGKIVVMGTNLLSRSSGQNKIKGTTVALN